MNEFTTSFGNTAAEALPEQRAQFIRKTYMLLAAAILAFIGVEAALFVTGAADMIATGVTAMEFRASAEDVARMSHAHPTYMEAVKEACLAATENRPIHI